MIEERIFNNRYRLDRKLGEGGMATVYCGTDILLRRRVAIKVLLEQYAADAEFVRRFYQEAESAAKLSHPNIVNTYDVGQQGGTYFIVMELVDGPSLAEIIAADGRLPEPVAIDYAAQIASGLAYAHRQGLLHRDIKPANVLVTKDDVVKLSDFGIARAVSQQTMALTKPGLVMGSVYYISPEQAQEHELHETADLYSLGIVLYQMLTGKLPYTGRIAGNRRAQTYRRPGSDDRRTRNRRQPRVGRDRQPAAAEEAGASFFARRASWRPRCGRLANAQASQATASPTTRRPRLPPALPPRRSPMPDRPLCRAGRVPTEREPRRSAVAARRALCRAARRNCARLLSLRQTVLTAGRRSRGRRLFRHDASRRAGSDRQCRIAHPLYEERKRNRSARPRHTPIAAGRNEGREESGRRAGRQQRKTAARARRRARIQRERRRSARSNRTASP